MRASVREPKAHSRGLPRRLFVDVSIVRRRDAGTGIQRIVRAIAQELSLRTPAGCAVYPVACTKRRPHGLTQWPRRDEAGPLPTVAMGSGDVFLGLDFDLDGIRRHRRHLLRQRRRGARIWFTMYDLLPFDRPEWFPDAMPGRFRRWLAATASLADGYICISRQTEMDLRRVLSNEFGLHTGYSTVTVPMAGDVSVAPVINTSGGNEIPETLSDTRFTLMVSTIEPRKGYADALDAFEALWDRGVDATLCIVGRPGWKAGEVIERLSRHGERGRRLHWFSNVDDGTLAKLYRDCTGVLVASEGEGYGLPVIEALQNGKPVLVRDLPVFADHEGRGATTFPANAAPSVLADCIETWLAAIEAGQIAVRKPKESWANTAAATFDALGVGKPWG